MPNPVRSRITATRCAVAALLPLLLACDGRECCAPPGTGGPPTPTLAIAAAGVTLLPGDSVDLTLVAGSPANATWTVIDAEGVATVSATGRVRASAPGIARVVATSGTLADTVRVSVPRLGVLTSAARHFCALTVQGEARCFGNEQHGELGDGTSGSGTPNVVAGGHTFTAISAGRDHTCGVRTDGVAMCWGRNEYGQLGTGTRSTDVVGSAVPVAVASDTRFIAIAAGESHTCAIATHRGVYCWGRNDLGQTGSESAIDCVLGGTIVQRCQPTPTRVAGSATFRMISAGHNFTCGVDRERHALCWGAGDWFARGDGTDDPAFVPTPIAGTARFALVGAGGFHACGITPEAVTYCWGLGNDRQNAFQGIATHPEAVSAMPPLAVVDGSESHSCAVTATGEAICWGANYMGERGNGVGAGSATAAPASVVGGLSVAAIATGGFRSCAITRGGALFCWGEVFPGAWTASPTSVASGVEFQR